MDLSNELISQFAKITKDQNKTSTESIVYGTAVMQNNKLYVNIDGSNSITPVVTSSEIKAGERVTVMIKDHTATVMGNISNPSASTETVGKVLDEYDVIVAKIGNFELLIADKISTEELEAKLATINEALIGKATIAELEAVKASIKDLDVSNLQAEIARIDKAIISKADIIDLDAVRAEIDFVEADIAEIETLIGGNLTMDNIQSLVLTASKVTVDNAFIKDAMVDRISASKLDVGTINTDIVNIASEDGSMAITGSLQQFKDANGNVRIQIGKDANGDFTFALYGEDGQGQLINQNGITASAISDGLIVNDMVADNAAIAGNKLDIDSVITEINGSTTTIKSSKIFFDDTGQSLEVAFNKLETKIDNMGSSGVDEATREQITTNTTNIGIMQGQIGTLISNTTITKENGVVVQMKDEFSTLEQTVNGFSGKLNSLETNYGGISSNMAEVNSKMAEFTTTLEGFATRVSDTEVKMNKMSVGAENFLNGTSDIAIPMEWTDDYNIQIAQDVIIAEHGLEAGDVVTFRAYINSSNANLTPILYFRDESWNESSVYGEVLETAEMPGYVTVTAEIPEGMTRVVCYLSKGDTTTTAVIEYSKAKLERGSIPTDWSMSIADTRGLVDEATQMALSDGTVVYIKDKVAETSTTIDGITSTVSALETHFDENGTITELTKQVSTLKQVAAQFTMEFFTKVDNAEQGVLDILSYMHFDADGITIGQESYPIRLMLTKDRIKFIDTSDIEVAYFSEGKLYVNNAEILDTFKIGNYGFMATANGGITIGTIK